MYQIVVFNCSPFFCSPFCMDIFNFAYLNIMLRFPPNRQALIILIFGQRFRQFSENWSTSSIENIQKLWCHAIKTSSLLEEYLLPSNHLVIFSEVMQFLFEPTNNYQGGIIWSFFSIFFWIWQLLHHPWLKAWMKSRKVENLET